MVANSEHETPADDGSGRANRVRLDHRRVGPAASEPGPPGQSERERALAEILAPFVAWLATQGIDEPERRRHRRAAERFLHWSHTDTGPVEDRRRRYELDLRAHDPDHLADARAGLTQWTDHRRILALTQPPTW